MYSWTKKIFKNIVEIYFLINIFNLNDTFGLHEGLETCQDVGSSSGHCADGVATRYFYKLLLSSNIKHEVLEVISQLKLTIPAFFVH